MWGDKDLTVDDCETFLYTYQQNMTMAIFRDEVVAPYSLDFLDILNARSLKNT